MRLANKLPNNLLNSAAMRSVTPLLVRAKAFVHQSTEARSHPDRLVKPVPPGPEWMTSIHQLPGMIDHRQVASLYELAHAVEEGVIVEVGSYRGKSTSALGRGSQRGHRVPVYAIEPHEPFKGIFGGNFGPKDRKAFYESMLASGCWDTVRLVNLSSERVAPIWDRPVGLLFIDGDHTYEGVRRDFEAWEPHLLPSARVAFDDAVQTDGGPFQLISELVATGKWVAVEEFGKMAVLERE